MTDTIHVYTPEQLRELRTRFDAVNAAHENVYQVCVKHGTREEYVLAVRRDAMAVHDWQEYRNALMG